MPNNIEPTPEELDKIKPPEFPKVDDMGHGCIVAAFYVLLSIIGATSYFIYNA